MHHEYLYAIFSDKSCLRDYLRSLSANSSLLGIIFVIQLIRVIRTWVSSSFRLLLFVSSSIGAAQYLVVHIITSTLFIPCIDPLTPPERRKYSVCGSSLRVKCNKRFRWRNFVKCLISACLWVFHRTNWKHHLDLNQDIEFKFDIQI